MNLPQSALYTPRDQYLISKNAFIYQMHLHFIGEIMHHFTPKTAKSGYFLQN